MSFDVNNRNAANQAAGAQPRPSGVPEPAESPAEAPAQAFARDALSLEAARSTQTPAQAGQSHHAKSHRAAVRPSHQPVRQDHDTRWVQALFRHHLGRDAKPAELKAYRAELEQLVHEGKSTKQVQHALVNRLKRSAEFQAERETGLPPGVSAEELSMVENAIYNEANGLSFKQQAMVAQAIRNYARKNHTSVKNIVLGGRGGIAENYLFDNPKHLKGGGRDLTAAQRSQIHKAALKGLNQALPGFEATHWRGDGHQNNFF